MPVIRVCLYLCLMLQVGVGVVDAKGVSCHGIGSPHQEQLNAISRACIGWVSCLATEVQESTGQAPGAACPGFDYGFGWV